MGKQVVAGRTLTAGEKWQRQQARGMRSYRLSPAAVHDLARLREALGLDNDTATLAFVLDLAGRGLPQGRPGTPAEAANAAAVARLHRVIDHAYALLVGSTSPTVPERAARAALEAGGARLPVPGARPTPQAA